MGPILAHQTAKFKLSGQFRFSRHPWGPWGRLSSGVICISKIYQLFCDSGAALVDFFKLMKMLPNVSFISMVIKKVFLSVFACVFFSIIYSLELTDIFNDFLFLRSKPDNPNHIKLLTSVSRKPSKQSAETICNLYKSQKRK